MIYPDTIEEFRRKGRTDSEVAELLQTVNLEVILTRFDHNLDSKDNWNDLLSGGERQRMIMARLFYHRPKFAMLDEATSAVSIEIEGSLYKHAQDLGITLLTITHRKSLWKYHNLILYLKTDV